MAFTQKQVEVIIGALKGPGVCSNCGGEKLLVMPEMILFAVQSEPRRIKSQGVTMPCVITICQTCALTSFFNVHALGVADELGLPPAGEAIENG